MNDKLSLQRRMVATGTADSGIVSRYFSALSERSETGACHRALEVLVRELTNLACSHSIPVY
jgi:hypothetical protein